MRKQGNGGSIIYVLSTAGLFPSPPYLTYALSKAALGHLTRILAVDLGPENIRVNAIVPGTIDTPMNAVELSDPEIRKHFAEIAPARRLGVPEDMAGIAVFLASEDSDYCVGGIFAVDGGLTAV